MSNYSKRKKNMIVEKNIALAVDTCFSNGSFSIWKEDHQIASKKIDAEVLLSKELIVQLRQFLSENRLDVTDIKEIIYTNGPGSNTAVRVGIASVVGICRSLKIKSYGVSGIEALSVEGETGKSYTVAILQSRHFCIYEKSSEIEKSINLNLTLSQKELKPNQLTLTDFAEQHLLPTSEHIVCDRALYEKLMELCILPGEHKQRITVASDNESILAYKFYIKNKELISKRDNRISYTGIY